MYVRISIVFQVSLFISPIRPYNLTITSNPCKPVASVPSPFHYPPVLFWPPVGPRTLSTSQVPPCPPASVPRFPSPSLPISPPTSSPVHSPPAHPSLPPPSFHYSPIPCHPPAPIPLSAPPPLTTSIPRSINGQGSECPSSVQHTEDDS